MSNLEFYFAIKITYNFRTIWCNNNETFKMLKNHFFQFFKRLAQRQSPKPRITGRVNGKMKIDEVENPLEKFETGFAPNLF